MAEQKSQNPLLPHYQDTYGEVENSLKERTGYLTIGALIIVTVGKDSGRIKYGPLYQHAPFGICWNEQNPLRCIPRGGPDTLTLTIYLTSKIRLVGIEPGGLRPELVVKSTLLHY